MGQWSVKSYDGDEAADAVDAAFAHVHGSLYEDLMDDRNPLSFDQVLQKLANPDTLSAAVEDLRDGFGPDLDSWDESDRLAFCGVLVRHAELGVPLPDDWRLRAISWLETEEIEWAEATSRNLRRRKEIALLQSLGST